MKLKTSYFSTKENFSDTGSKQSLNGDSYLDTITPSLSLSHDVSSRFSAYGVLDGVYARSQDRNFQRTRLSPADLKLGVDFSLLDSDFDIVPELQLTVPLNTVSETTDEIIVSESVMEARGGAYLSGHFDWLSAYAYLGYAYRSGGRSSLMPYEFQTVKDFGGLQASLGVWGYTSVSDDEYINTRARREVVTTRVNGGSYRFYSVNPSLTEVGGSLGLPMGQNYFARLGAQTTVMGRNSALGSTFWLSLSTSFGRTKREFNRDRQREDQRRQEQRKRDFVPDTSEDEAIFQQDVPRRPEPISPTMTIPKNQKLQDPGSTRIQQAPGAGPTVKVKLRSSKPKPRKPSR